MSTQRDVRRIALSLPGAVEREDRFAFAVPNKDKLKDFIWIWMERTDAKAPRVPNPEVVAVRVADRDEKESLLASDPDVFFTEPHYNGFPAVLVRLKAIRVPLLRELITDAWRCQAPKALLEVHGS